jgi:hypothetical protein
MSNEPEIEEEKFVALTLIRIPLVIFAALVILGVVYFAILR